MGALSPTHWLIVVGIVVLLFGAKKLPDAARAMGQSMRILKAETSGLRNATTPTSTLTAPHPDTPANAEQREQPTPQRAEGRPAGGLSDDTQRPGQVAAPPPD